MPGCCARKERADGHRGEHEAGAHDIEAEGVDEIERHNEDDRKLADGNHSGGKVPPGERGEREQAEVEKSGALDLFAVTFPDNEQDESDRGAPERDGYGGDRGIFWPQPSEDGQFIFRCPPTEVGPFDDSEDECAESDGAKQCSVDVYAGMFLLAASLWNGEERGDEY